MIIAAYIFLAAVFAVYQYTIIGVSWVQRPRRYGIASIVLGQLFCAAFIYALWLIHNG